MIIRKLQVSFPIVAREGMDTRPHVIAHVLADEGLVNRGHGF